MDPTVVPPEGRPLVLVCGKRGAGKSTLIAALESWPDAPPGPPPRYLEVDSGASLDTLEVLAQIELFTTELPDVPHHLVLVVGAPDRALDDELALVEALGRDGLRGALTLVLNQIDTLPPAREWSPEGFDPDAKDAPKTENIARWAGYVRETLDLDPGSTFLTVASPDAGRYGLGALRAGLSRRLAEGARVRVSPQRPAPPSNPALAPPPDHKILWVTQAAAGLASLVQDPLACSAVMALVLTGMLLALSSAHRLRAFDPRVIAGALAGAGASAALLHWLARKHAHQELAMLSLQVVVLLVWEAWRYAVLRGIAGPPSRRGLRR